MALTSRPLPLKLGLATLVLGLSLSLIPAVTAQAQEVVAANCDNNAFPCLAGKARVVLETTRGRVTVELDGGAVPLTAGNFLDLVQRQVYDGTAFHRVIPGFVAQGGDPQSAASDVDPADYGKGNFIDPASGSPRFIPIELTLRGESPRYGHELRDPLISDKLVIRHERGSLGMARANNPNSASAQFYIALGDLDHLDGRYAVFGRVVKGMDVVDSLVNGDRIRTARISPEQAISSE